MANDKTLAVLKEGVAIWNQWRAESPFSNPDLQKADLNWANLDGANLWGARLTEAKLSKAHLRKANLSYAFLNGADLNGADLWEADLSFAYLERADLRGARLAEANFRWAELGKSDLGKTNLWGANLNEAKLSGANLSGANLSGANLSRAKLDEANLCGADLSWANLSGAKLSGADLSDARSDETIFADIDLSEVKGLESFHHLGPSSIGVDTLYRSLGKIPENFLRGVGMPVELIAFLPSLRTMKPIQYYSCFISYSTKEQEFADRLHADLQSRGVRCWFAPDHFMWGRNLYVQIPEQARQYDKLLLVLSEDSMESEWVKMEIRHARRDEVKENRRKLFPISLVDYQKIQEWEAFDTNAKDMAVEIREYYIPDFSIWRDYDAYMKAFDRLMKDLNFEG